MKVDLRLRGWSDPQRIVVCVSQGRSLAAGRASGVVIEHTIQGGTSSAVGMAWSLSWSARPGGRNVLGCGDGMAIHRFVVVFFRPAPCHGLPGRLSGLVGERYGMCVLFGVSLGFGGGSILLILPGRGSILSGGVGRPVWWGCAGFANNLADPSTRSRPLQSPRDPVEIMMGVVEWVLVSVWWPLKVVLVLSLAWWMRRDRHWGG